MQPTGTGALHLGNLEGALRSWVRLQDEYEMFCCIVDWHALTTLYDKTEQIGPACREVAADYIAAGLDPQKCAIFLQSHVKEHAELHLLLSMITPRRLAGARPDLQGEARTDAGAQGRTAMKASPTACSAIPCLQAADILVYRAHAVPVGKDQAAHLEISREIARRFNHLYGAVFPEPQTRHQRATGVVPGLDGRKMSKSYGNAIYLADSPDTIAEKVKNAVHHADQNPQDRSRRAGNTASSASCAASTTRRAISPPGRKTARACAAACRTKKS